jgi:hypothetical protein
VEQLAERLDDRFRLLTQEPTRPCAARPKVDTAYEQQVAATGAPRSQEAFAAAWAAGRAMSLDEAVAFALDQTDAG